MYIYIYSHRYEFSVSTQKADKIYVGAAKCRNSQIQLANEFTVHNYFKQTLEKFYVDAT